MKRPEDTLILVVDDEAQLREIIAFDLLRRGYQVKHAENGKAALALVQSEPFDLVISDVRMPNGTGVELLSWMKKWNAAGPSFIFMTAFSDISADEALDQGAEAFLTKPLVKEDLLERVEAALIARSDRWPAEMAFEGVSKVSVTDGLHQQGMARPRITLGSGGAFVELQGDFPASLEIIEFDLPFGSDDAVRLQGFGRVRWVRHEATQTMAAGIGVEFLALAGEARQLYLDFLAQSAPKAYVPLY